MDDKAVCAALMALTQSPAATMPRGPRVTPLVLGLETPQIAPPPLLPLKKVNRVAKRALPSGAILSREAQETIQRCTTEFISYVTSQAAASSASGYLESQDILATLSGMDDDDYSKLTRRYVRSARGGPLGKSPDVHRPKSIDQAAHEVASSLVYTSSNPILKTALMLASSPQFTPKLSLHRKEGQSHHLPPLDLLPGSAVQGRSMLEPMPLPPSKKAKTTMDDLFAAGSQVQLPALY